MTHADRSGDFLKRIILSASALRLRSKHPGKILRWLTRKA
jgi:hypothetical protein